MKLHFHSRKFDKIEKTSIFYEREREISKVEEKESKKKRDLEKISRCLNPLSSPHPHPHPPQDPPKLPNLQKTPGERTPGLNSPTPWVCG